MAKFRYGLFRAKRRDGKLYPKWRIRYFKDGKPLHSEIGYTDKGRTEEKAREATRVMEHEEHLKAVGVPVAKKKALPELIEMWLGEMAQSGGKQNYPSSPQHVSNMRSKLAFWVDALGFASPAEVNRAEVLAAARKIPVGASTQEVYIQAIRSFLSWCVKNDFLSRNPLFGHRKQAAEPAFKRRALTVEEALRLLAVTTDRRALIYKGALLTGMRRGELDSLTVGSVDWDAGKIKLEARHAKNRKSSEFYLPAAYQEELYAFSLGRRVDEKLFLGISETHSTKTLRRDLKKAGVAVETPEGRIDFHALRVTFLTWINELGEDVKTVQDLARHSDPRMTFGTYTKSREERLRSVITQTAARLFETSPDIPRLGGSHAGVTQALREFGAPVLIGVSGVRLKSPRADDHDVSEGRDIPGNSQTSPDINQAKANAREFFTAATSPDIPGHSEPGEMSRRSHTLISQITEALSRLPSEDLEAILQAIASMGRGRGVA
ncbi:MAG TPA: site-specific integrase [Fibrobacteria bacterium]|nr:site-specific integrase [Fibrobacteria bacterium]